jgi:hypothetical protein
MAYLHPRTQLATHEVTNQVEPLEDVNLFSADAMLKSACDWSGAGTYAHRLSDFGARVGAAETQRWAAQADRVVPTYLPYTNPVTKSGDRSNVAKLSVCSDNVITDCDAGWNLGDAPNR